MKVQTRLLRATALFAAGMVAAADARTVIPTDKDGHVRNGTHSGTLQAGNSLYLKTAAPGFTRIGYFSFDLSSAAAGPITEVQLDATIEFYDGNVDPFEQPVITIYGLNESVDNWSEATLTFNDRLGIADANGTPDLTVLTLLNTVSMPGYGDGLENGQAWAYNTQELLWFINADTDGRITLVFFSQNDNGLSFLSKEANGGADAATLTLNPEETGLTLGGFTYDRQTGDSEVRIKGKPSTAYILVGADDLDFANPDQFPVPLSAVSVGTRNGNIATTDINGDATVQFNLGTSKPATFIRAEAAAAAELAIISANILGTFYQSLVSTAGVDNLRSTMLSDGSWPDINYSDTSQTAWKPQTHLLRLRSLAMAYSHPDSPFAGDPAVLADALKALDYWLARDPQSNNWWFNEIEAPRRIGETLLLLEPYLSPSQLTDGLAVVARAYMARSINSGLNTGVNRTDRAYSGVLRGLLTGDKALLSESFGAIRDTVFVTTDEGIQPDWTFHQHGPQLHMQGYGLSYISSNLGYASWSAGTAYAFASTERNILINFLLDGTQWYLRGDSCDFTASGRSVTRVGQSSRGDSFLAAVRDGVVVAGDYRQVELQSFENRRANSVSNAAASSSDALLGHKHFWRSDSTTFHRPGMAVFLKTSSTRTEQPESGNGEGLKNLHLADGVTIIQRHGNEYDEIMPCGIGAPCRARRRSRGTTR